MQGCIPFPIVDGYHDKYNDDCKNALGAKIFQAENP
jgi:hypothetical protein